MVEDSEVLIQISVVTHAVSVVTSHVTVMKFGVIGAGVTVAGKPLALCCE